MPTYLKSLWTVLFAHGLIYGLTHGLDAQDKSTESFFENKIRPVLVDRCVNCHGGKKVESGLDLTSAATMKKGGDSGIVLNSKSPEESLLLKAIRHDDGLEMPPDEKLSDLEIANFTQWIKDGARWPDSLSIAKKGVEIRSGPITESERQFWSLQPIREIRVPDKTKHAIDAFVDQKLEQQKLEKVGRATKAVLIRRATFDLTGLPPTPSEIKDFLKDNSTNAFQKVIDRLLQSEAYGERWGRHWLDVVRYADTAGETGDYPVPLAYKYRNWVIDAFNDDLPYDEFVRLQLAGDLLAAEQNKLTDKDYEFMLTATGFIAISRRFGFDVENYHFLTIQDTIDTVGQSMLGLSIGCARCHDHKFDPINLEDYYAWYGIFESTRYSFPGSEEKKKSYDSFPAIPPEKAMRLKKKYDDELAFVTKRVAEIQEESAALKLGSNSLGTGEFYGFDLLAEGPLPALPYKPLETVRVNRNAQSPFENVFPDGSMGVSMPRNAGNNAFGFSGLGPYKAVDTPYLYYNIDFRNRNGDEAPGAYRMYVGFGPGVSGAMELSVSSDSFLVKNEGQYQKVGKLEQNKWYNVQVQLDLRNKRYSGRVTCEDGSSFQFKKIKFTGGWNGQIDTTFVDKYGSAGGDIPERDLDNVLVSTFPMPASEENWNEVAATNKLSHWHQHLRQTQLPLSEKNRENHQGFHVWRGDPLPVVGVNSGKELLKVPGDVAPSSVVVHPNPKNGVGVVWKSPVSGKVTVTGRVKDAHNCGDSVLWYLDQFKANGEFKNHGAGETKANDSSKIEVPSVDVNQGEYLQLAILPKAHYGCDLTDVVLEIECKKTKQLWNLSTDVLEDFVDEHPNDDQYGNADVWCFTEVPTDRGRAVSKRIQESAISPVESSKKLDRLQAELEQRMARKLALEKAEPFDRLYAAIDKDQVSDSAIHIRGNHKETGSLVARRNLEILGKDPLRKSSGSGRKALAEWITRDSNPLFSRVMVNRIWQNHFGRGIVGTENDFGTRGERPTHPELLDWLAVEFKKKKYSVKAMHRLIMTSEAYQRSSDLLQRNMDRDPESRFLWRQNRRRLSAEEMRDSMLFVSGQLERGKGGMHPFPPESTWAFSQHAPFYGVYPTKKRSIYLMQQRLKRHPFLALFDGADTNVSTARRLPTTVPTQALYLMNSEFVHEQAMSFAKAMAKEKTNETERVRRSYWVILGRAATEDESNKVIRFLNRYAELADEEDSTKAELNAFAAFARTLLTRNEFLFVD